MRFAGHQVGGNAMQTHKNDSVLKQQILEELKWDTRVDDAEVDVQVHNGVVILSGAVDSWAKRIAARDAALRVAGVRDVADEIQVRLDTPTKVRDADIAEAARHALRWNAMVPDARIKTMVTNGVVTLTGTVDHGSQRDDAARAVGQLAGVCAVSNEIHVMSPVVAPITLLAQIENALERRAIRETKKLKIEVEGSKVTVSGNVDSFAERTAIIGSVRGTRGVQVVVDDTRLA